MLLASYKCFSSKLVKRTLTTLYVLIYMTMGSCGTIPDDEGEFIGHHTKESWKNDIPLNMKLIPSGTFLMHGGVNEGGIGQTRIIQTTTVPSFYMDEAPVTNAQYRAFLDIVRADLESYGLNESYINEKLMPDVTVWQKVFPAMFIDDSYGQSYWQDPRFDDYPVVGITWEAAEQYARVRSIYRNNYLVSKGRKPGPDFRLPTAAKYEYAAKGGQPDAQYPWGGPSVRDPKTGKLLANFQATKGDYAASGYAYTSPIKAFPPNAYGLYDMAGNVAEWCADVYSPLPIHKNEVISPFYKDEQGLFKVIKGGSWKDYAYALQTGVSDCEHKDIPRCYIGFRCVMSAM